MIAIAFLIAVVAVCVLGAVYGADSRHTDAVGHHRPNL
jgi:hypothetical protein